MLPLWLDLFLTLVPWVLMPMVWFWSYKTGTFRGRLRGRAAAYREAAQMFADVGGDDMAEFFRDVADINEAGEPITRWDWVRDWLKRPSTIAKEGAQRRDLSYQLAAKWAARGGGE